MSVQGNFGSGHSNNRKGERNLEKFILQTRVSFDVLVRRKKFFLESGHHIETHLGVLV